jgi:Protein kinase domain/Clostridial hydrophobic W
MPEHNLRGSLPRVDAVAPGRLGGDPLGASDPGRVGPYVLVSLLGSGGMGRVYLGRDTAGERGLAAVKVIRPEYAEDAQFRARFEREATALGRVRGPRVALLVGTGFDNGLVWIATDYVPGRSLSAIVAAHGPIGPAVAWQLAGDLGTAVETMSAAGVVHRDLKPSNVIMADDGARVIDLGIAQAAGTSAITTTGQQVGTPAFMSPEQVRGTPVTTASDIFALGSTLAYAVSGRAPFGDGTSVDVLLRVAFEQPDESVLGAIAGADPVFAAFIAACLAKDPARRPTPAALIEAAAARQVPDSGPPSPAGDPEFVLGRARQDIVIHPRRAPESYLTPATALGVPGPSGARAASTPATAPVAPVAPAGRRRARVVGGGVLVAGAVIAVVAAITMSVVWLVGSSSHPAAAARPASPGLPPADTAALAVRRLAAASPGRHVCYRAYVQGIGWQKPVCDGAAAGTVGESRAIQALNIAVSGVHGMSGNGYLQKDGWVTPWKIAANGINLYLGTAAPRATHLAGFAVNVGSGTICANAHVHIEGWHGVSCDTPGSYIFAGTLTSSRWLEAVTLTV